MEMC